MVEHLSSVLKVLGFILVLESKLKQLVFSKQFLLESLRLNFGLPKTLGLLTPSPREYEPFTDGRLPVFVVCLAQMVLFL